MSCPTNRKEKDHQKIATSGITTARQKIANHYYEDGKKTAPHSKSTPKYCLLVLLVGKKPWNFFL